MELRAGGLLRDWIQCQLPPKMSPPNHDIYRIKTVFLVFAKRVLKILIIYSG